MSINRAFGDADLTPANFSSFSKQEISADTAAKGVEQLEPIPPPRSTTPMELSSVIGGDPVQKIQNAGKITLHTVGDTGGIHTPEFQFAVADAMATDLASGAAFWYHLGDVVYYFGQEQYYFEQFYDPYRNYNAPIFAIPGNHDGVMFKNEPVNYSLEGFIDNFCAASPAIGVSGFARTTMIQPGAYFVLTAPFARFIGLYSNTGESVGVLSGDVIGNDQVAFLQQQLAEALAARKADTENKNPEALILAVHHPPFTGASDHFPSASMLQQIDACCQQAGIWPDLVLSGHAHLYERYTRTMKADGRQIPYLVAGNGGYYNLSKLKTNAAGKTPTPGQQTEPDGQGNTITLEQFNDTNFGFLRITVNATTILVEALTVSSTQTTTTPSAPIPAPVVIDQFTVNLSSHTVTSSAASKVPKKASSGAKPIEKKAR